MSFDPQQLAPNTYAEVDEETFEAALAHYGLLFDDYLPHDALPSMERADDFVIHLGDVTADVYEPPGVNVLIVGSLRARVVACGNGPARDGYEGMTLQVSGDVVCRDFDHAFEHFTVIGGALRVSRFLNLAYEDSECIVKGDATIALHAGFSLTCDGEAKVDFGDGMVIGLDYWSVPVEARTYVGAASDLAASSAFAGFDLETEDVRERLVERIYRPREGA